MGMQTKRIEGIQSLILLETIAAREGIRFALVKEVRCVIVERDAKGLFDILQKMHGNKGFLSFLPTG